MHLWVSDRGKSWGVVMGDYFCLTVPSYVTRSLLHMPLLLIH